MDWLNVAERLAAMGESTTSLDRSRCLHAAAKVSSCRACFELCPADAIQAGEPPSLDVEACAGCLACLPACPVGAYTARDAVPALLNCAARLDVREVELICEAHPGGKYGVSGVEAAIRIRGCLAGLGVGAYLGLVALGLENVVVRTDACAQCPWGDLQSRIEAQIEQAQQLVEPMGLADVLACAMPAGEEERHARTVWSAGSPPVSRRDLFRLGSLQGRVALARALAKHNGEADSPLSRDRQRILAALDHLLEEKEPEEQTLLENVGFAEIVVDDDCNACGTCARACPTGALDFRQADMHFWLTFSPRACVDCAICVDVCAQEAISIRHAPVFSYVFGQTSPVTLQEGELTRCERCNAAIAAQPGVTLCPICEFRKQNPFGSVAPPTFKAGHQSSHRRSGQPSAKS